MARRNFSGLTLKDAMELVPVQETKRWDLYAPDRAPSETLLETLRRFESFALTASEAAKVMLIDVTLAEIVPLYPQIKIWKSEPLEIGDIGGVADYLIAPRRAYMETPLLCAIQAKRDDFYAGEIQCIAEMAVCQQNNARDKREVEVHGIVSNGLVWVFYHLTQTPEVFVSGLFTTSEMPKLLGTLDHVIAACAANVP